MPVKIIVNRKGVETRIEYAFNQGMGVLANEILNDCNQYCKMDTGNLIASSYINSKLDEGKLIWQTPYARRQYWEIRTAYTDNGNPKATWKWCEVAKKNHLKQWERQAQIALRENL
jgi:hypothetical protein